MAKKSKRTGSNPLKMAKQLTLDVNRLWKDKSLYDKVTPVTSKLLEYWFSDSFCHVRKINFHEGQKQALLNIIYAHEVLKIKNVMDLYLGTNPQILQDMSLEDLDKDKYQHPMYAVKMATGTGKTWVLNALLIWQYLNAREGYEGFSKNFLIVAPGLIVYDRLLDSFLGKESENGKRNFETSDFIIAKDLFIPKEYENIVFGFLQSSVATKNEISSKVTGDGLIAITNWHNLVIDEDDEISSPIEEPHKVVKKVLPVAPGTHHGNSLDVLDNNYLKGGVIDYLTNLDDLVVFNDEAHHIHEIKKGGEIFEVEWQKSLNQISINKNNFIQFDFSATPFNSTSGKNKIRHYFPHIIVDFDLKTAIHKGLVKMIAIDKRNEVSSIKLDFKSERDGKEVIGLSAGQRVMLRAGLKKLKMLEEQFVNYDKTKYPKMLVMCEDTKVAPFVTQFLIQEKGLKSEDILEIHSTKKGQISEDEWNVMKQKLFNVDKYASPKVIISVLMLREGFDVNNICVIVPLRSTDAPILLEQTIGRGLRLMWREPEHEEIKYENRVNVLVDKKAPNNYLDLLSIIEHPKFMEFYDNYIESGIVTEITDDETSRKVLGDMITVELKENFKDYDMYWPSVIRESEEIIKNDEININFEQFPVPLENLQKIKGDPGEIFESQELTVRTRFGRYSITEDLFSAENYNEFLYKIVNSVLFPVAQKVGRKYKSFPQLQVRVHDLIELVDDYICTGLFGCDFDPMVNDNWKILFMAEGDITKHIVKQISKVIYEMQHNVEVTDAIIKKYSFSDVDTLKMRENYSIEVSKSIYERLPYPSNGGGFEKRFIEAVDRDSRVDSFIKVNEYYHTFAAITYIRHDGLLARYYPDFIVKISNDIYVVETKADKDLRSENVRSKQIATWSELDKINELKGQDRMDAKWNYVLLGETTFDDYYSRGASIKEILDLSIMTEAKAKGTLDDYL